MKAVLKFRADLGRDLVTPQGGIMNIKLKVVNFVEYIFNGICRFFRIRLATHTRALSDEEVKALGLDRLEEGQKMEKWIVEKPTEM